MFNYVRLESGAILDLLHHPCPEAFFSEDGKSFVWFEYEEDKIHAKQHQEVFQKAATSIWALIHQGDFVGVYEADHFVIKPVKALVLEGLPASTLDLIKAVYIKKEDRLDLIAWRNEQGEMEGLGHLYRIN
jgi:hypothetical protein